MEEELRTEFHKELEDIKIEVLRMADYVTELIPRATESFLAKDLKTAQDIIDGDDALDRASVALDERCCQALALQQPMAKDLRGLVSAMSLNNDIERSADLAANVSKAGYRVQDAKLTPELEKILKSMGERTEKLLQSAAQAYRDEDIKLADELDSMDDLLDDLNYECFKTAIDASTKEIINLETAVHITLVARYFERIGDHAVNMGERVHYMVTGVMVGDAAEQ